MRAELARATKFEGQVASPDDCDTLIAGPGLDETAQGAAQLDEPPGPRKRRGEDVRVDRHDGQIGLRARCNDGACNAVVDAQFIAEREVETGIEPGTKQIR